MGDITVLSILPHARFQWRVEDADSDQVLSIHRTKPEAVRIAKEIIQRSERPGTLRIHGVHGQVCEEHRYGMPREKRERVVVGGGRA